MQKPVIREIRASDVAWVAELERLCNPMPWNAEALRRFASDPKTVASGSISVGRAAHFEGVDLMAGYVCAGVVGEDAEILVLGVHPKFRRRGIARALLMDLRQALRDLGCKSLFLEVRKENKEAVSLYRKTGFMEAGLRKGYYADTGEDALLFRWDLSG